MEAKLPLNAALGRGLASHADIFSGARISSSSAKNVCVAGYSRINAGGVLPYISRIGMCAPSGSVFAPFWSENRDTVGPFWSGNGYGVLGTFGSVYEHICRFNSK